MQMKRTRSAAVLVALALFFSRSCHSFAPRTSTLLRTARIRQTQQTQTLLHPVNMLENDQVLVEKTYEAQITPEMMMSFSALTVILIGTAFFWWTTIIPQQRTKLAISKSRGEVKEYLKELKEDATDEDGGNRGFERWLYSDWLNAKKGDVKPGALPFLKKAKWNSGDNPLLVAFGGIMSLVIAASFAERF